VLMSLRDRIFAAGYDPLSARWEKLHGAKLRKKLLEPAQGRVLEIGVGTGLNLPHYPPVDELVAADPSEPMLRRARRRAAETGRDVTFVEAPAEQLPFEDASFDTVVCTLVLCTVKNPERALSEIERVLRPGGNLLFLEHVRADEPGLARWQDRIAPFWRRFGHGCNCNRPTPTLIRGAGFDSVELEKHQVPKAPPIVRPLVAGRAHAR
jgi:ubiquinone/menaquinone biosynthesis C-methylase UbiE